MHDSSRMVQSLAGNLDFYGTRSSKCEHLFIKEMLLGAASDSPTEIREWCKTETCRLFCDWMGIDINDYRKGMLRLALGRENADHPMVSKSAEEWIDEEIAADENHSKEPAQPRAELPAEPVYAAASIPEDAESVNPDMSANYEDKIRISIEDEKYGPLFVNNRRALENAARA